MSRQCSVRHFVEIHKLLTELGVFEAKGVANFGTRCIIIGLVIIVSSLFLAACSINCH